VSGDSFVRLQGLNFLIFRLSKLEKNESLLAKCFDLQFVCQSSKPYEKQVLLSFTLCLLLGYQAFAQWSQNPGQPTRVCSVNSVQNKPTTIPDGQGGAFVFWEDNRFVTSTGGNILLYAQRFGADGTKLFADTGKLIQTKFSGIRETNAYGISQDRQGNFWVTYSARNQTYDSMVVCK
jgi:hypothetical protein